MRGPSSEKDADILIDFGLTRNQAKVYIAVVRLGIASVGDVSKVSKVRREDVYRILPKLEKLGLVEKLLGTPTRLRAAPVEEALPLLIKIEEDAFRERVLTLKTKTKTFLKHFAHAPSLEVEEKANFVLLSKREGIMNRMLAMVKKAEKEFDVVFSRGQIIQFVRTFSEQLKRAIKKGTRIRIISEMPEFEDSLPRVIEERISLGNSIELRYTDMPFSHYMIVDFTEALMATATEGNMADNPCLWTNSDSLKLIYQGNFEKLWHNSMSWKTVEKITVSEKVIRFMEQLRPTNHLLFVYNSPEAKHNVLFNYLKVGLEKEEAGVYVTTEENPSQIREAMKRFGIEVEKKEKADALQIFEYEDIYSIDGKFDMDTTMNLWKKLYNETLKRGFKGLRITGEMTCFFKHNALQELIEYEKALHRVLDIPITAVCAYNANTLTRTDDPINLYTELSAAHSTVLFTGIDDRLGRMEIRKV